MANNSLGLHNKKGKQVRGNCNNFSKHLHCFLSQQHHDIPWYSLLYWHYRADAYKYSNIMNFSVLYSHYTADAYKYSNIIKLVFIIVLTIHGWCIQVQQHHQIDIHICTDNTRLMYTSTDLHACWKAFVYIRMHCFASIRLEWQGCTSNWKETTTKHI